VDNFIAFRLWKYTLFLLERHIKDKKKLPLIAPIVLYHGKSKYTAAKSLWDLFEDPSIAKQLMGDEHLLVDLQSM
jgi:predicted transposase YdaD